MDTSTPWRGTVTREGNAPHGSPSRGSKGVQYVGGKHRLARKIAPFIEDARAEGGIAHFPFCGALSVVSAVSGRRSASDGCESLVTLYSALRDGWEPPAEVSADLWQDIRARKDPRDPLTAFAGFGCSFGGKYFAGYAKNKRRDDFTGATARGLARKMRACEGVPIVWQDFAATAVNAGDVVYCDPPYANSVGYPGALPFHAIRFLATTRHWIDAGARVLVSEYEPLDPSWVEIARFPKVNAGTLNRDRRCERLFEVTRVLPKG